MLMTSGKLLRAIGAVFLWCFYKFKGTPKDYYYWYGPALICGMFFFLVLLYVFSSIEALLE